MEFEKLQQVVFDAGIVGAGGAGFPTHVKLSPKEPDKIDYILVNCAECEPYITSDHRMMLEHPELIADGIEYLRKYMNFSDKIFDD